MSRLAVLSLLAALAATACAHAPTKPTTAGAVTASCAALPATYRTSLRLAPDGQSLYWVERFSRYGYTEGFATTRLMRWPLAGDATAIGETLLPPFRVLDDGRVVANGDDGVYVWDRGELALISSWGPDIDHLELLGDQRALVYLAEGSLVVQPIARAAGQQIAVVDDLLGVDGARVYVERGGRVVALDAATGAATTLPVFDGDPVEVHGGAVIGLRGGAIVAMPVAGGATVVVAEGDDWELTMSPAGVLAQRKVDDRIEVGVVSGTTLTAFPPATGVATIEGVVRLPDGRAAYLVSHDTDRDGEVGIADESDVCVAAVGATTVAFTPRDVPARHAAAAPAIDQLVAAHAPGATWRLIGAAGLPRVVIDVPKRLGDHAARRALVTTIATALVAAIGDDAYDVELRDADGRRVTSEWQAWSRKRLTFSGAGAVLAASLDEASVVVELKRRERTEDGKVACEGTITARDATYRDVVIDCVDGASWIEVPARELRPGEPVAFSAMLEAPADADFTLTVHHGEHHDFVLTVLAGRVAADTARVAIVEEVLDRTDLTVAGYRVAGDVFVFDLEAPAGYGDFSHVSRAAAAGTAHDLLAKAATTSFDSPPGLAVWLRITADGLVWNSDGGPPFEVSE